MPTSESLNTSSLIQNSSFQTNVAADTTEEINFQEAPLRRLTPLLMSQMSEKQLQEFVTLLRSNRSAQAFRATIARQAEKESGMERSSVKVNESMKEFF